MCLSAETTACSTLSSLGGLENCTLSPRREAEEESADGQRDRKAHSQHLSLCTGSPEGVRANKPSACLFRRSLSTSNQCLRMSFCLAGYKHKGLCAVSDKQMGFGRLDFNAAAVWQTTRPPAVLVFGGLVQSSGCCVSMASESSVGLLSGPSFYLASALRALHLGSLINGRAGKKKSWSVSGEKQNCHLSPLAATPPSNTEDLFTASGLHLHGYNKSYEFYSNTALKNKFNVCLKGREGL